MLIPNKLILTGPAILLFLVVKELALSSYSTVFVCLGEGVESISCHIGSGILPEQDIFSSSKFKRIS